LSDSLRRLRLRCSLKKPPEHDMLLKRRNLPSLYRTLRIILIFLNEIFTPEQMSNFSV